MQWLHRISYLSVEAGQLQTPSLRVSACVGRYIQQRQYTPRYPPSFDLLVRLAMPSTNLSPPAVPALSSHSKLLLDGGVSSENAVVPIDRDSETGRMCVLGC